MTSVGNYPDCADRILESESPLFPLGVILFLYECRQRFSGHTFLREALQLSICPFKRLLAAEGLSVTSKQVVAEKNSKQQGDNHKRNPNSIIHLLDPDIDSPSGSSSLGSANATADFRGFRSLGGMEV